MKRRPNFKVKTLLRYKNKTAVKKEKSSLCASIPENSAILRPENMPAKNAAAGRK